MRRSERRGSVLVEFALSFGFLFTVLAGVFQFGYLFQYYNTLETAVRGGARYASLRTYDSSTETPSTAFRTAVQNMVVYGNPDGGTNPVALGLTPSKVTVTVTMERNVPRWVTVGISNLQVDAVVASITLNGKPRVVFPDMGRYAP